MVAIQMYTNIYICNTVCVCVHVPQTYNIYLKGDKGSGPLIVNISLPCIHVYACKVSYDKIVKTSNNKEVRYEVLL